MFIKRHTKAPRGDVLKVWPIFGTTKVPSLNMLVSKMWKPCCILYHWGWRLLPIVVNQIYITFSSKNSNELPPKESHKIWTFKPFSLGSILKRNFWSNLDQMVCNQGKNLKIHIKKSPKHFNYSKIYLKYLPIWQYVKFIL